MRRASACTLLLLLAGCTTPAPAPTPTPMPTTGSVSASPPPGAAEPLAIYYTVNDGGEPKLIREFHTPTTATKAGRVRAAVNRMLDGRTAHDPDYASLWPAGARATDVEVSGALATVDVSGAARNPLGAKTSHIAVQQLVWTATAVEGVDSVRILLDGKQVADLWGHVDVSKPLKRAPAAEVLYQVWLISPQHGDVVGKEVTLHIAGIVPEATVQYEILKGRTVVKKGYVTVSDAGPKQGDAKTTVTLEPGIYTIVAYWDSPADATRQDPDNHVITVR